MYSPKSKLTLIGVLALAGFFCSPAGAENSARAEVEALLDRLGASGCQFNRNGTWYDAKKARSHLVDKLNYIQRRTKLESAEQFIAMAATKSSVSGKPYSVRCADGSPVASASWLSSQLRELRSAGRAAGMNK